MTITHAQLEDVSTRFATTVVAHLQKLSESMPRDPDVEPAPALFSEDTLRHFYRLSMMRSVLSLVEVEPPGP